MLCKDLFTLFASQGALFYAVSIVLVFWFAREYFKNGLQKKYIIFYPAVSLLLVERGWAFLNSTLLWLKIGDFSDKPICEVKNLLTDWSIFPIILAAVVTLCVYILATKKGGQGITHLFFVIIFAVIPGATFGIFYMQMIVRAVSLYLRLW